MKQITVFHQWFLICVDCRMNYTPQSFPFILARFYCKLKHLSAEIKIKKSWIKQTVDICFKSFPCFFLFDSIDSIKTVQSFNLNGYLVKIRLFKQIGLLLLCSHCFQSNIKKRKRGRQHEYSKIGTKNEVFFKNDFFLKGL